MVKHNVLLKLKEGTDKEQLEKLYQNMLILSKEIPGIISINSGENISPEDRALGFSYGFFITFKDFEALKDYLIHPSHKKVAKDYILPIVDDILVFDYAFE